jgi:hypothetical protein
VYNDGKTVFRTNNKIFKTNGTSTCHQKQVESSILARQAISGEEMDETLHEMTPRTITTEAAGSASSKSEGL